MKQQVAMVSGSAENAQQVQQMEGSICLAEHTMLDIACDGNIILECCSPCGRCWSCAGTF